MRRTLLFIFGLMVCLTLIFRPIALIQGINQNYSENKILIEYEIYGCGSLVIRVIQGGEQMATLLKTEYPDVAIDEVRFTEGSDEPYLHLNSAEFWTAGLARGSQYIIEGEVVGATKGALKCCAEDENDVAYNEIVPEFQVDRWFTANYMPYYKYGNGFILFILIFGIVFCFVGTIIALIKMRRNKQHNPNHLDSQGMDSTANGENMTQKQIAGWIIEIDKDTTELAYAKLPLDIGCTCHTCRNYIAAISAFPNEVLEFFEEFGIDPAKPSEVYENKFENNKVLYGGFYHIVGDYISGDDIWQPVAKKHKHQKTTEFCKITDDFQIGFTHGVVLVPDKFPRPVLQMEISFNIPWVLDESYNS